MKKLLVFFTTVALIVGGLYFIKHENQPKLDWNRPWTPITPIDLTPPSMNPAPNPKQPAPKELNVIEELKPLFRKAQAENKRVFIMLSMDNCVYCELMKKNVFPNVDMSNFVFLETKNQRIISQYMRNSSGFPTYLILDNNGNELRRHTGYLGVNEFRQWLQ